MFSSSSLSFVLVGTTAVNPLKCGDADAPFNMQCRPSRRAGTAFTQNRSHYLVPCSGTSQRENLNVSVQLLSFLASEAAIVSYESHALGSVVVVEPLLASQPLLPAHASLPLVTCGRSRSG